MYCFAEEIKFLFFSFSTLFFKIPLFSILMMMGRFQELIFYLTDYQQKVLNESSDCYKMIKSTITTSKLMMNRQRQ